MDKINMWKILLKKHAQKLVLVFGILIASWFLITYSAKAYIISRAIPSKGMEIYNSNIVDDEYFIYSAIIEMKLVNSKTELILIQKETNSQIFANHSLNISHPIEGINPEVWNDFILKNQDSHLHSESFMISRPYMLIDQNEMVDFNRKLSLINNVNYSPYLMFSNVGFSAQKDQALVEFGICSLTNSVFFVRAFAFGSYIYLNKVDGVWKIIETWESFIT